MKLGILHISDIHATGENDPALSRTGAVVNAIKNLQYGGLDAVVIAISGDIAYGGREDEYFAAWIFFDSLKEMLRESLQVSDKNRELYVYFVAVPGNHDCLFGSDDSVRDTIIDKVLQNAGDLPDTSMVNICTSVQRNFFEFLDQFANDCILPRAEGSPKDLYYEYAFTIVGEQLSFLCFNTAWLSRRQEQPSKLCFPTDVIQQEQPKSVLSVAILHHPYNWLEPNNARRLRNEIEKRADVVLTGHEHDPVHRRSERGTGERNTYLEGAVFQCADPDNSGFNFLLVDTGHADGPKQKFFNFQWADGRYVPGSAMRSSESDESDSDWEDLQLTRQRIHSQFVPSVKTKEWLDDVGVVLQHPQKENVSLADVFVYPDLLELAPGTKTNPRRVRASDLTELLKSEPCVFIAGDDECGKTSLCKTLYVDFLNEGYVPILVRGQDVKRQKSAEKIYSNLERLFVEQYCSTHLEAYKQLERGKRLIIVDDFHLLERDHGLRREFVAALVAFSENIILVGDALSFSINEVINPTTICDGKTPFSLFSIQPLGHKLRNDLVEKWIALGGVSEIDSREYVMKLTKITQILDTLIGKNYVPAFPVYMLSVLQAAEAGTQIDIRASTHGYFYELLIRNSLAKGSVEWQFDLSLNFLTHLAYDFFTTGHKAVDSTDLSRIKKRYEELYAIELPDGLVEGLKSQRLLVSIDSETSFKYPFIFYYFVALHLRDHIEEDEVRTQISRLASKLHVTENANILLFLSHLSKSSYIVDTMLASAERCYAGTEPANMGEDVEDVNLMWTDTALLSIDNQDTRKSRQRILESLDERQAETDAEEEQDSIDSLDPMAEINTALKSLQILGQILKNFTGSMKAEEKYRIASACYDIGLKTLSVWLKYLKRDQEDLCAALAKEMRRSNPSLTPEVLEKRARSNVAGLATLMAFSVVRRTSVAVGSPRNHQTFERILKERKVHSVELISASLELDHSGSFPERRLAALAQDLKSNPLAYSVLRYLVYEHLCLFKVNYKKMQRICEDLNISYQQAIGTRSNRKLIE